MAFPTLEHTAHGCVQLSSVYLTLNHTLYAYTSIVLLSVYTGTPHGACTYIYIYKYIYIYIYIYMYFESQISTLSHTISGVLYIHVCMYAHDKEVHV